MTFGNKIDIVISSSFVLSLSLSLYIFFFSELLRSLFGLS